MVWRSTLAKKTYTGLLTVTEFAWCFKQCYFKINLYQCTYYFCWCCCEPPTGPATECYWVGWGLWMHPFKKDGSFQYSCKITYPFRQNLVNNLLLTIQVVCITSGLSLLVTKLLCSRLWCYTGFALANKPNLWTHRTRLVSAQRVKRDCRLTLCHHVWPARSSCMVQQKVSPRGLSISPGSVSQKPP